VENSRGDECQCLVFQLLDHTLNIPYAEKGWSTYARRYAPVVQALVTRSFTIQHDNTELQRSLCERGIICYVDPGYMCLFMFQWRLLHIIVAVKTNQHQRKTSLSPSEAQVLALRFFRRAPTSGASQHEPHGQVTSKTTTPSHCAGKYAPAVASRVTLTLIPRDQSLGPSITTHLLRPPPASSTLRASAILQRSCNHLHTEELPW
jgi:hypothetical protein